MVGSDYSDEDEYIKNYGNKYADSENQENKENKDNNQNKESNKNNKKSDIKMNLMSEFQSYEKEINKDNHKEGNNYYNKGDEIFRNINAQSK